MINRARLNENSHKFCCKECRQHWYKNVWSQDATWKDESRKRAAKLLKNNKVVHTKPQAAVDEMLDELGIVYINEQPFVYYSIDNYMPDCQLAIEVMGDFWHCNRIKYDTIKYTNQANSIRRDKAKKTYLEMYHGIPILYLWETDINNRPDVVKGLITLFVNNNGKLENYHSVNYEISNGSVLLRDICTVMYQDMSIEEMKKYINIAS